VSVRVSNHSAAESPRRPRRGGRLRTGGDLRICLRRSLTVGAPPRCGAVSHPLLRALLSGTRPSAVSPNATSADHGRLAVGRSARVRRGSVGVHTCILAPLRRVLALAALVVFTLTRRVSPALAGGAPLRRVPRSRGGRRRRELPGGSDRRGRRVRRRGVALRTASRARDDRPRRPRRSAAPSRALRQGEHHRADSHRARRFDQRAVIEGPGRARAARLSASLGAAVSLWAIWRTWLRLAGRDDVPLVLVHRGVIERLFRTARYTVMSRSTGSCRCAGHPTTHRKPPASAWWLLALAVFVIAAYALARLPRARTARRRRRHRAGRGSATSPLVSPINEHADRYAFLATLGGALFWGSLVSRLVRNAGSRTRAFVLAACVVPLVNRRAPCGSALAFRQNACGRRPSSALPPRRGAWTGLSATLQQIGRIWMEPIAAAAKAIALEPAFLTARVNSVYNRLARGDIERARIELEEIRRRGGAHQLGMRRATQCAAGDIDSAAHCIGM